MRTNTVQIPMERPIIFKAEMVRAILDGRKTQTRRIVKKQFSGGRGKVRVDPVTWGDPATRNGEVMFFYEAGGTSHSASPGPLCIRCPYGVAGDRLWVRETWGVVNGCDHYSIKDIPDVARVPVYRADGEGSRQMWRPSIHMPRWASRLTLEITGVRVERLNQISNEDCIAEGIKMLGIGLSVDAAHLRIQFKHLWDSINGEGAWDQNPWVWVVEFRRVPSVGRGNEKHLVPPGNPKSISVEAEDSGGEEKQICSS